MMNAGLLVGLVLVVAIIAGVFSLLAWAMGTVSALALFFIAISLIMILVVLIQRPRGGGLSGAFGGAGGNAQAAFGAKTGDMLTWVTVVCFVAFLVLSVGLTWAVQSQKQVHPAELQLPAADEIPVDLEDAPVETTTDAPTPEVPPAESTEAPEASP